MPDISPLEILMVAVIALIVFGPDKLPGIARNIGRTANDLRRMANEMRSELRDGFDVADEPEDSGPGTPSHDHPVAQVIRADAGKETAPGESSPDPAAEAAEPKRPADGGPGDAGA